MTIKLVAIDLDDTLLNKSLTVSPRAAQAIRQAVEQGTVVTVATGRMYQSALPYARQLELDVPLITYNGALIKAVFSGKTFFHQPILPNIAADILALCRENGWHIHSYINDNLYVAEMNEKTQIYVKIAGVTPIVMGDKLYDLKEAPTKMLIVDDPERMGQIADIFHRRFANQVYITSSKPKFLEFTHPQVNKGWAVSFLGEMLGIDRDEIMAVGDSGNDVPMLEYAGLGVAMGNAKPAVKAAADVVTLSSDDDGVAEAIEKYVLR